MVVVLTLDHLVLVGVLPQVWGILLLQEEMEVQLEVHQILEEEAVASQVLHPVMDQLDQVQQTQMALQVGAVQVLMVQAVEVETIHLVQLHKMDQAQVVEVEVDLMEMQLLEQGLLVRLLLQF